MGTLGNVNKTETFTDPASNPSLSLNTYGRPYLSVYALSLSVGATVIVYGSNDDSNYYKVFSTTTDSNKEYSDVVGWGWRYAKVVINETGSGTAKIVLGANR